VNHPKADPPIDHVLDHCDQLDETEFARLGLAALDQAGLPLHVQQQVESLVRKYFDTDVPEAT
jgi:hypothetical protein